MVGTAIGTCASVTVQCAQDHKCVPVSPEDSYALQAVLAASNGADRRLTDVHGHPIDAIIA